METALRAVSFKYSAFISYSHDDERWAKWLQSSLETYRIPSRVVGTQPAAGILSRRLGPVFRDRSDLPTASDLSATINEALRSSANLIVICSPGACVSRWVNEEIIAFRRLGRGDRIFSLIVAGEPNATDLPGREAEECFAPALRSCTGIDGQPTGQRLEPVAADVRAGADGKSNAKLKILAGLLDVDFDELKQREHRRRNRQMAAITALALVMMMITTGLAIDALVARQGAEQRQKEAETLVDFMLGDLNDKLRQVQRLDILEAVDNQAMRYFSARPGRDVNDQTLALRLKALQKIGNVREDQGKLPAAMESYQAAAALAAELVRRAPGEPEREAAYAETLHHVGNAYWFLGDLDHALESFQRAIVLLERATAVRPSDATLAVLAYARINEGRVREARGEFAAAKTLYEAVLATFKTLVSRHGGELRWRSDLADAYDSLAKVALEQGQLTQAIAAYYDVRRIRTELMAVSPDDHDLREGLLNSTALLGGALALCGADAAAAHYVGDAVRMAKDLIAFDATQGDWQLELGKYNRVLGHIARRRGLLDEAALADNDAMRVLTALVATDQTNSTWRRELARAQVEWARLQLTLGAVAEAEQHVNTAVSTITAERASSASNRTLRLLEAQAFLVFGEAAARRHDAPTARERWARARDSISSAAHMGAEPDFLAALASALLWLDDTDAARPVVDELATMGYQSSDFDRLLTAKRQRYRLKPLVLRCGREEFGTTAERKIN